MGGPLVFSVPEAAAAAAGAESGAPGGRHALHPREVQLAAVLRGDERHRGTRRLRPVRPGQGRAHASQGGIQVRRRRPTFWWTVPLPAISFRQSLVLRLYYIGS